MGKKPPCETACLHQSRNPDGRLRTPTCSVKVHCGVRVLRVRHRCTRMNVSCRTPRSVCVLSARCPSCLCVPFFLRPGHFTRSHRASLCQHAFPKGEDLGARHAGGLGHTFYQPLCAQQQDLEPLLDCRELRSRQQGVSSLASQTSWAEAPGCSPFSTNARVVAPITLVGCIEPKRVILKSPSASRNSVQRPPRSKTPVNPSSSRMDGRAHVSSSRVDGS